MYFGSVTRCQEHRGPNLRDNLFSHVPLKSRGAQLKRTVSVRHERRQKICCRPRLVNIVLFLDAVALRFSALSCDWVRLLLWMALLLNKGSVCQYCDAQNQTVESLPVNRLALVKFHARNPISFLLRQL